MSSKFDFPYIPGVYDTILSIWRFFASTFRIRYEFYLQPSTDMRLSGLSAPIPISWSLYSQPLSHERNELKTTLFNEPFKSGKYFDSPYDRFPQCHESVGAAPNSSNSPTQTKSILMQGTPGSSNLDRPQENLAPGGQLNPLPPQSISQPQPQTSNGKRKRRKKPEQSHWQLHYRYLTQFLAPHHYTNRSDPRHWHLWQIISRDQNNKYIRDPNRSRSRHARLQFIFAQRKRLAREKHERRMQWAIIKRRRERLYRLAYLRFKKGRIEMLVRLGRLRKAYRLGWSAFKEWLAWRGIITWSRRRWCGTRSRRKRRLISEEGQLHEERRVFEMGSSSLRE